MGEEEELPPLFEMAMVDLSSTSSLIGTEKPTSSHSPEISNSGEIVKGISRRNSFAKVKGMMQNCSFLLIVFVFSVCLVAACLGGFLFLNFAITQETTLDTAISLLLKTGLPFLEKEIVAQSIPDLSGSYSSGERTFLYSLSQIHIDNLDLNENQSDFKVHRSTVIFTTKDASTTVSMNWSVRMTGFPNLGDSGGAIVTSSHSDIQMTFVLNGLTSATIIACSVQPNNLNIKFTSGSFSFLYNIFSDLLSSLFKNVMAEAVCNKLINIVISL